MFRLKEDKRSSVEPSPAVGWVLLAVCLVVLCSGSAWALGTPAGMVIANTATVEYTLSSDPTPFSASVSDSFTVLEVIDTVLVWQDAGAVPVNSPQNSRALTFLLTNTGNGPETFALTMDDTLAGDDFNPSAQALWLETNAAVGLQTTGATPDTLYQPGVNDPDLAADGMALIYLLSNIPSGLSDAQTGQVQLTAASATAGAPGAPAGTELVGAGFSGVNAVVGTSNGDSQAVGTYVIETTAVNLTKSIQQIVDPSGGSQPCPGARVTYRLAVAVTGSGTAEALTLTDIIPADMTYLPGSIVLDGAPQTDAADAPADTSDFNVTSANTVTVNLGDTAAPAVHSIEFTTTINN